MTFRLRIIGGIAAALITTAASARASELPSRVDVRADRLSFYPYQNQTLLAGEGHVTVREGARTIEGDTLRYDVINNKVLVTGNVKVRDRARVIAAEAYALDLPSGNAEVLQIGDVPTTFSIHDDDATTAKEGPPSKDAFAQIDIDNAKPYIKSKHAIVTPGAGLRMSPADFPTPIGPAMRLPTFLYTLVQNNNIAQTSLPGSTFDQPLNLTSSPGSVLAAHLRYDSYYGPTIGFDEHLVNGDKSYAVISAVPFRNRQVDLLAYEQIRSGLQQTLNLTHTIGQYPYNNVAYKLQNTGRSETLTFQSTLSNADNSVGLDLATISHDVGHYFTYQMHTGYSYNHNYEAYPEANDFRTTFGANLSAPSVNIKGTTFDERYLYNYTAYDYPHQLTDSTAYFGASHQFPNISLTGNVQFEQTDDRFRDVDVTDRALGLPDPTTDYLAPDGTYYPGYFAYAGLSTLRQYQSSATFGTHGDNKTIVTMTYTHDFPQFHGYGRPPLTAQLEIVRRITPTIRIDVGRSYTFGWDGRYLSPQYTFSISP